MLKILIGFDYELFLGENFVEYDEVLIKPTYQILEMLEKNNVTATLFADVCCARQYKKYEQLDFVEDFEKQLISAQENGFDVQLHIHSNWLNSSFDGNRWDISPKGYRIHEFGFSGENSAQQIIRDGIDYLNGLIKPHNSDYKCIAYRAGGYSIQPHSELVRALRENGVFIDSSVCRHQYIKSNANNYDFRKLPRKMNWWLSPDKDFSYEGTVDDGGLFEVPMCGDKNSMFKRLFVKDREIIPSVPRKGSYVKLNLPKRNIIGRLRHILNYNKTFALASFDSMPPERMFETMKKIERKYDTAHNDVYISIIGHPKLCNEYVLNGMEKFIKTTSCYRDRFEFITFRQLYDELCKNNQIKI